jgi:predicted RNase H-like nuclease (RuvC/YqgF family)
MADIQKLKALAEAACPRDDWYEQGDLRYVDDKTGETHGFHHHDAAFVEAASPAAVLELIAEIESLRAAKNTVECRFEVSEDTLKTIRGCLASAESDIDKLKAENTDLHATLHAAKGEIERLKGESEALRKDADRFQYWRRCWACEEGASIPDSVEAQMDADWDLELDGAFDAAMSKEAGHD